MYFNYPMQFEVLEALDKILIAKILYSKKGKFLPDETLFYNGEDKPSFFLKALNIALGRTSTFILNDAYAEIRINIPEINTVDTETLLKLIEGIEYFLDDWALMEVTTNYDGDQLVMRITNPYDGMYSALFSEILILHDKLQQLQQRRY